MKTIYKYPIEDFSGPALYTVELPKGYRLLKIDMQGTVTLWCVVDTEESETETFEILILGTGHPLPIDLFDQFEFYDTIFGGPYVWHVFTKKQ